MAYFKPTEPQQPKKQLFKVPVKINDPEDDPLQDWEDDPAPEEQLPDEEVMRQRDRAKIILGVSDFFGIIAGAVVILLMIALLVSLINWVMCDVNQFLEGWR